MQGQVNLSIEEYEKLQDKVKESDVWEAKYTAWKVSYEELEHKYNELLMEKIYKEYSYIVSSIYDTGCDRSYLISELVKNYNMDSITKISQVIDELIEMYKEKKDGTK